MQAVETAAPTGQGLTELEEAILLQAEMMDLKAGRSGAAEGTTVEARMTKGQGPVATVIVKWGALKVGGPCCHVLRLLLVDTVTGEEAIGRAVTVKPGSGGIAVLPTL